MNAVHRLSLVPFAMRPARLATIGRICRAPTTVLPRVEPRGATTRRGLPTTAATLSGRLAHRAPTIHARVEPKAPTSGAARTVQPPDVPVREVVRHRGTLRARIVRIVIADRAEKSWFLSDSGIAIHVDCPV